MKHLILVLLVTSILCQEFPRIDDYPEIPKPQREKSFKEPRYRKSDSSSQMKHRPIIVAIIAASILVLVVLVKKVKKCRQQKRQRILTQQLQYQSGIPVVNTQPQYFAVPIEQYQQFQRWLSNQQQAQTVGTPVPQPYFQQPQQQQQQQQVQQGMPFQYAQTYPHHFEIQQPSIVIPK